MTESKLREIIQQYLNESIKNEDCDCVGECECEDIEEVTVTGNVDGYSTPNAFKKSNGKKKKKAGHDGGHGKPDVFGFSVVKEELDKKDLDVIRKLIKDVISDVYRDIWLKRSVWK